MNSGSLTAILRQTFSRWNDHEAQRLGAALAFYTLLSLAPLVVFLLVIMSLVFNTQSVEQRIVHSAQAVLGHIGANTVRNLIASTRRPAQGIIATAIAVSTLAFGASAVFGELRDALNKMWDVRPRTQGVRGIFAQKVFSFVLVLAAGFLLLVSMLATAIVSIVGHFFNHIIPVPTFVLQIANFVVSFAVLALVFALIFRYVPDLVLPWSVLWTGAAVSALFFVIGKTLLGLYLSWAGVGSAYGAAGSLVAVAFWVYYSAQIFLFGAEFTYVCGRKHCVTPAPVAERR
ncbi:MAG: ribonuclease BN [Acidobacteria bacterium]|nr:MAG: ribonuclease BN [Acidobacteriota bacterium]